MSTVVNNPAPVTSNDNGSYGAVIGLVLVVVLVALFLIYGLPLLRGAYSTGASTAPQVNVPGKVDVNVNHYGTGK